ncbi:MAG: hypothetical protein ABS81_10800 [Pseudonocardia sp. SCN 72-86]|nr:MAG: hypothetical protein ABS81_10800 [Pseudonocardia sp. SCN 72-86]
MLWVDELLGAAVRGPAGEHLGHLRDLGLKQTRGGPLIEAILIDGGGRCFILPSEDVMAWGGVRLHVRTARQSWVPLGMSTESQWEWLAGGVLSKPVLTTPAQVKPIRVSDIGLRKNRDDRWIAWLIDTRPKWLRRLGFARQLTPWTVLSRRCVIRRPSQDPRPRSPATVTAARIRGRRRGSPTASAFILVQRSCLGLPNREPSKGIRHVDLPR